MQIIKNKINFLFVSIFLCQNALYSQQPIKFKHIKAHDGLSQGWVKTICQDQQGFMWFGTYDGLNKYDGYSISSFYQEPENKHSLHNNSINAIYKDSKGNLWIGTDWGFCLYDLANDQFIHQPQWSNGLIMQFLELSDEQLFVSTSDNGLLIYDLETGLAGPLITENNEQFKERINCMLKDSRGNIWFGMNNGLALFNPRNNKLTFHNNESDKLHSLSSCIVLSLLEDKQGRIWVGTINNGLFLLQYETNHPDEMRVTHFVHNPKIESSISPGLIKALLEDKTGHLWVGTQNGGVDIVDLNNFREDKAVFRHNRHDPFDNTSLSNNSVYSLFEDHYGGIWIGTYKDGVNYYHPQKEKFVHKKQQLNNPNSLNNNLVNALYEEDSLLWIGTENGINLYNKNSSSYSHFVHDPNNKQTISADAVLSILRDSRNNLWVGTWAGGLNLFDGRNFKCFKHDDLNRGSISNDNVTCVYEDREGVLWVCTVEGGLDQFDYKTKTFKHIGHGADDSHRLSYNSVNTILEDSFGKIWISTMSGVDVYDRETGLFKHILYYSNDVKSVNGLVYIFFEDSRENLWLGTNNGLNVYNRNENNFDHYTKKDGLPNNQVKGILEDAKGNLWISTNKGLSKFIQATKRPDKPAFKNYDLDDGLQGEEFTIRSCFRGQNGKMYFGGNNGFNVFHPDSIKDNSSIPPVIINNFLVDNQRVPIREQDSLLTGYSGKLEKPTLNYKNSVFTVEYVMLNYFSVNKNEYAYMLEGFDKDWHYVGNQRRATYTNMDPGEYTFRVKGTINNNWDREEASIKIEVIPSWWKTGWAYLFYTLFTGYILFNIWRFQLNRRALKHELLLGHQHVEKLEELNKMKSHFFANITHEFRSPLTLIMGPMQQLVAGEIKENFKEIAGMILRNSKRMYHLINQILELSKLETGYIQLQTQKTDIIVLIEKIMSLYESFAESKNINLKFIAHNEIRTNDLPAELYIDVDKIKKVIVNLLSNALKYTPQNGNIHISVKRNYEDDLLTNNIPDAGKVKPSTNFSTRWKLPFYHKKDTESQTDKSTFKKPFKYGFVEICVKDDGIGIPEKDLNKVFDRFYQGVDPRSGDYESVGIGLALTKELVELHSGTIHVESVHEQGSQFFVRLPLGTDHLHPSEIVENSVTQIDAFINNQDEKDISLIEKSMSDEIEEVFENRGPIILIVDDNADIRKYVVDHLKEEYQIITAKDGLQGLEKAKSQIPDLIISDINMPKMNGIDLCSQVKKNELTCHIPVILLTVRASQDAKIGGLELGADDYITKPFEIRELRARIRNIFEQRHQIMKKLNREYGIQPSEIATNSIDEQLLKKALSIVESNISESLFGVEELSQQMSISRSQLYRKIFAITGQTPVEFIRSIRLNRAAQLLKQKHDNIARIAYEVGFNNPSYFSNSFYKQFGMYPTDYKKQFK